jgi:hypothetical protein
MFPNQRPCSSSGVIFHHKFRSVLLHTTYTPEFALLISNTMIVSTFLQFLALVVCEGAVIQRRDEPNPLSLLGPLSGILAGLQGKDPLVGIREALPQAKITSVKTLTPRLRPDANRVSVRYGPYTLAGKGVSKYLPIYISRQLIFVPL